MYAIRLGILEKIYVPIQLISRWDNERSYPNLYNLIAITSLFTTFLVVINLLKHLASIVFS